MARICALIAGTWLFGALAHAQHGDLQAQALLDPDGRYGAGLLADAVWGAGRLRLGASFAVGAVSNAGDQERSNVIGAVGPALWIGAPDSIGLHFLMRAGGFAGGEKGGLIAGAWGAPSLGHNFEIGPEARLRLALEVWLLYREELSIWLSPAIGMAW